MCAQPNHKQAAQLHKRLFQSAQKQTTKSSIKHVNGKLEENTPIGNKRKPQQRNSAAG